MSHPTAVAGQSLWRRIPLFGGLFIVLIVALAAYDIERSRLATIEQSQRELAMQARVIADQTARSVQAVDLVLRHVAEHFRSRAVATLGAADGQSYLKNQSAGLLQIVGLTLLDSTGAVVATSDGEISGNTGKVFADTDIFRSLRGNPQQNLLIGNAIRSPFDEQRWVLPIMRRLETRSGAFAGVIVAEGRIDHFRDFYRSARLDDRTRIALVHQDGLLIARYPPTEAAIGKPFEHFDTLSANSTAYSANPETRSPIDGVMRFASLHRVPEYSLAIVVARDVEAVLAPWREQSVGTALRTLALATLAGLLLALLRSQVLRLDRTRESLEISRERFALAAKGSDVGIWDWDMVSDRVIASARAREIFGAAPGPESQSRSQWFESIAIHPDDAAARSTAIRQHLAGKSPVYEGEYRVRDGPDGEYRWIRVRGLCVRDAAGVAQRMAGSVADIDSQKRAEDALRLSEQRFALAVAGSNDGIVDWDLVNDRMYTSERTIEMLGIDTDQTVRTRAQWMSLLRLHPDDVERHADELRRFLASNESLREAEYRILCGDSDADWRWIRIRNLCVRDPDGRPLRLAGSVSDIDPQKRIEAALRESEARYELAMTGSNEGHWVWDVERDELFASAKLSELLGRPPAVVMTSYGEYFATMPVHPDDVERLRAVREGHLAGTIAQLDVEFRIVLPDTGEVRWLHTRGTCFRDSAGKPLRVAGATVDATSRKLAEESLRRSEERYALAVSGSDDGVWDWDYVNGLAFESARARELQGLPLEPELQTLDEVLGAMKVHPDDAPLRAERMRAHLAGETPAYECEYRTLHPDGVYRWVRVRALCIRDEDGKACRMAGSVADIDSRKRAEDALRESEQRFALAVAGSNDGILDWDVVNDRMYVSDRARSIVGIAADAEVNTRRDWSKMLMPRLHPEDSRRLIEELRSLPDSHPQSHDGEYRIRHPDGQYRWTRFRGMSVNDSNGELIRWAGSISDIDAAKQTEEALRRSEERYQLAVAGSNEGLWDWDLTTDSLFLSARAQELLWLEPGEPLRPRREWIALTRYHDDDQALVRDAISKHLHNETRHFKVEYRLWHHDGGWHWYRQRGIAVRDQHGRATRMAGSMEDITERKNFELDRDRLESQLRQAQKLEAIGTLAGGIAHDFNNILSAILGYGEMAQKDALEGSSQRRHIDAMISAGMRAKSLVERILAFSRTGVAERVPVHVSSVVGEALDLVAASLPAGIQLERHLESSDAAVLGDPTQVHQVVMNLCANAAQAMNMSGRLTVSLDLMGVGGSRCATSVLSDANHIRLRVQDTGVGIHPRLLERIFDPFFTTQEIGVGTGLGLSLVHGIVTELGGGIEVQSELGVGSTFTVYLPWQSCIEAPTPLVRDQPPNGNGQTILLVDDESALVRLGEEIIAELGYEPVGFTSSAAALECLRADPGRFQAVLSDEAMPEMTGCELACEIRRLRPELPVVLMSGFVSAALTTRARDAGVIEVLAKPLVALDIARSLARLLQSGTQPQPEQQAPTQALDFS